MVFSSSAPPEGGDEMNSSTLRALTLLYGYVGILCVTLGFTLNLMVLRYFYRNRSSLSNTLYSLIVLVDALLCLLTLPYALPHLTPFRSPLLYSSPVFCKAWGVAWGTLSKCSVCMVCLLSCYRTVLLVSPLNTAVKAVTRRGLVVGVACCAGALLLGESVQVWFPAHIWYYDQLRMRCEWAGKRAGVRSFWYIWNTATLAVPVLPVLVSAVLSVYGLRKNMGASGRAVGHYASVTIILFTLLYVFLNLPTLVYWGLMTSHWISDYSSSLLAWDHPYFFFSNLVEVLCVSLNATLNPCLYLARMRDLRAFLICTSAPAPSGTRSTALKSAGSRVSGNTSAV